MEMPRSFNAYSIQCLRLELKRAGSPPALPRSLLNGQPAYARTALPGVKVASAISAGTLHPATTQTASIRVVCHRPRVHYGRHGQRDHLRRRGGAVRRLNDGRGGEQQERFR